VTTVRARASRSTARPALIVDSGLILLLAWALASRQLGKIILPPPKDVWEAFRDQVNRGVWWTSVRATLGDVFTAFGLIVVIGVPLGVAMGRLWFVDDLLRVPMIFLQTVPTVVLVAIALIAIGTNTTGVIFVTVASGVTFFTLNVIQGARAVEPELVEMAHAYGAGERTIVRSIVLPSVIPYLLAGGRIALGVTWHVTLVGEYLMGTPSVGFAISNDIKFLDTASVLSWGLTIVFLTIALEYGFFRPVERVMTRHTRGRA
jgi:NitT/TauT family transport system permease protein